MKLPTHENYLEIINEAIKFMPIYKDSSGKVDPSLRLNTFVVVKDVSLMGTENFGAEDLHKNVNTYFNRNSENNGGMGDLPVHYPVCIANPLNIKINNFSEGIFSSELLVMDTKNERTMEKVYFDTEFMLFYILKYFRKVKFCIFSNTGESRFIHSEYIDFLKDKGEPIAVDEIASKAWYNKMLSENDNVYGSRYDNVGSNELYGIHVLIHFPTSMCQPQVSSIADYEKFYKRQ